MRTRETILKRVRVAATGNVNLATLKAGDTVNGVVLAEGDYLLLPAQTAPAENGVQEIRSGGNRRAFSFDAWDELANAQIFVEEGTVNARTYWRGTSAASGTVDTTAVTFVKEGGGGLLSKSIAGGAGTTVLTSAEAANDILELTGTITGNRVVEVPATTKQWTVYNGTTGAFTVTVKVNGQTGIVVASTKRAILYSNGTDVVRATADV